MEFISSSIVKTLINEECHIVKQEVNLLVALNKTKFYTPNQNAILRHTMNSMENAINNIYQSAHQTFEAPKCISFIFKQNYHGGTKITHSCSSQ